MVNHSSTVRDYFFRRQHVFRGEDYNAHALIGNLNVGDVLELYLQIENEVINSAYCKAYGSVAVIAMGEYTCEWLVGKTIAELDTLSVEHLLKALDLQLTRIHIASMAIAAIKQSITDYHEHTCSHK